MSVSTFDSANAAGRSPVPIPSVSTISRLVRFSFDAAALTTAHFLTLQLRYWLNPLFPRRIDASELDRLAPNLGAVLLLWTIAMAWRSSYRPPPPTGGWASKTDILESALVAAIANVLVFFFSTEFAGTGLSRSFVFLFIPVSVALVALGRQVGRAVLSTQTIRRQNCHRAAIIGHRAAARMLAERMNRDALDFQVVGIIVPGAAGTQPDTQEFEYPLLGRADQLAQIINQRKLQHLVVLAGALAEKEAEDVISTAVRMNVMVDQPMGNAPPHSRPSLRTRFGVHVIEIKPHRFTRGEEFLKRAMDLVITVPLLILLAPLFAAISLAIRLTSSGPLLYRSERVGRGGRHFTFLKFRSMYADKAGRRDLAGENQKQGPIFKVKRDPRITPVGSFLRRYSLDELPQLLNVLRGDMSLLGPRPLPAEDLDPDGMSQVFSFWAAERAKVLPGMSGLWQVMGRSDLSFDQMVELDLQYIQSWSIWQDLRILLKTPVAVLRGKGAY